MNSTKGPWFMKRAVSPGKNQENDYLIYDKNNRHIAEVFQYQNHDNPNGSSLGNAQLIISVHDLLGACEAVIDNWHSNNRNFDRKEPEHLKLCRKAIAEVKGEIL